MFDDNLKKDSGDAPGQKRTAKTGISRRGFLKGAGLTTAGTVMLQGAVLAQQDLAAVQDETILGPEAVTISLRVNGRIRQLTVEPRTTLAQALRVHLELTGTKVVCDRGSCSACTVWVDKKPVNSCMTLALDVMHSEITTVEGIARDGVLHPVQEAFIEHDAAMCGFCTPGMIMSSVHLVESNPNPALADVKHALRGNVCRCGTYPKVFDAVLDASAKMKK
jgi:xanthine dehydrogenase YagT iron-sulfur-binding subunit